MRDNLTASIERLDAAVRLRDATAMTQRIKHELEESIRNSTVTLPDRFLHVRPEGYARRLLHRNDELGYTAVVMTWVRVRERRCTITPGSGASKASSRAAWTSRSDDLVEAGRRRVPVRTEGLCARRSRSAGCLIPPFEYHVLANARETASVTLHIYGGEMTSCHVFEPIADGRYVRRDRALCYHD